MKISCVIIIFGLFSCQYSQENKSEILYKEEYTVINDVFLDLVGTKYYYENKVPRMPGDSVNDTISINSSNLFFIANDSFIEFPISYITYLNNVIDNFNLYFNNIDSNYIELLKQLPEKTIAPKFDVDRIANTGKYKLVTKEEAVIFEKGNKLIGSIIFSSLVFDNKNERAVFYASIACRDKSCGEDLVVLIEKRTGKWKIVGTKTFKII